MNRLIRMSADGSKNKEKYFKVIIIGAGVSGLSAAQHLTSNGIKDLYVFSLLLFTLKIKSLLINLFKMTYKYF